MLDGDLRAGADWDFGDLTGGSDLGSRASICGEYRRLDDTCSVVN